jgi:formate dehydrogenase subunit gamma
MSAGEEAMGLRCLLAVLAVCICIGAPAAPARAQHGQDVPPAPAATSPSGANPTAEAASEQRLLQEMRKLQGRITIPDHKAAVLEQPQGRTYQFLHERVLPWAAGILIIATVLALAAFYFTRGRITLEHSPESGIKVNRFNLLERLTHWLTASSFIVLAITGLNYVFGKRLIFPLIGPDAFAVWTQWAKFAHDTIAWPFMIGVLLMLALWVRDNMPDRYDWRWLREFGGFVSGSHPPARRFNAGQKLIFWSVAVFGLVLTASGIIMLFPFWTLDINGMQWAQFFHWSAGAVLIAIIIGHIYIGTLGMEGAYDAMWTGQVDLAWARAHHSVWVEEEHLQPERNARHDVARRARGVEAMRVIFSAIAIAIVLALLAGGGYYLGQEPVYRAQSMDGVRVGDPGDNLVGRDWTGEPSRSRILEETRSSAKAKGWG